MADEGFQDNFNRWWSHGSTSSNCVATMLHKKYTPRIFGQNQGGASPVTEVLPPAFWAKERYDVPQVVAWSNNGFQASAVQPIHTAVSTNTGGSLNTLAELSKQFRSDQPKYLVANLNCSGFEQKPGETQRVLYTKQSLADFRWTMRPTAEGSQECNLMIFLEGVPIGSDTPGQMQI